MKKINIKRLEDMWAVLNCGNIPEEFKINNESLVNNYQGGLFKMLNFLLTEEERMNGWKRSYKNVKTILTT